MENITFKVGEHCKVYRQNNGKVFLAVELNESNIHTTEKATYIDLVAVPVKESKYGESHFIKVPGKWNKEQECVEGLDFICGNIYHVEPKEKAPEVEDVKEEDGDMPF